MAFYAVIAFHTNGINDRCCDCGSFDFVLEEKLHSDDFLWNIDFGCAACFETAWICVCGMDLCVSAIFLGGNFGVERNMDVLCEEVYRVKKYIVQKVKNRVIKFV